MNVVKLEKTKSSPRIPRVLAITGGKGGVGKTSVSVNLAIALARTGSKVCLFDADTGLANINVMLGLHPAYTLEHLFTGEKSIHDILLEGPAGIDIIPG
ncbi:P-loop NTPase, partial [Oleiphilus sp. HI0080]